MKYMHVDEEDEWMKEISVTWTEREKL